MEGVADWLVNLISQPVPLGVVIVCSAIAFTTGRAFREK